MMILLVKDGVCKHPHDNMDHLYSARGRFRAPRQYGKYYGRQGDIQVMSAGTGIFHSEYRIRIRVVNFANMGLSKSKNVNPVRSNYSKLKRPSQ
jgi:redox-sensitive bicupin YhaK (pirin superfamily)